MSRKILLYVLLFTIVFTEGNVDIFNMKTITHACRINETECNPHVWDSEYLGDGLCQNYAGEYNTPECCYDKGDCIEFNEMYPNCKVHYPLYIGDGEWWWRLQH